MAATGYLGFFFPGLKEPVGAPVYLRTRNFATLQMGSDGKLWANWHCENGLAASYPLA